MNTTVEQIAARETIGNKQFGFPFFLSFSPFFLSPLLFLFCLSKIIGLGEQEEGPVGCPGPLSHCCAAAVTGTRFMIYSIKDRRVAVGHAEGRCCEGEAQREHPLAPLSGRGHGIICSVARDWKVFMKSL